MKIGLPTSFMPGHWTTVKNGAFERGEKDEKELLLGNDNTGIGRSHPFRNNARGDVRLYVMMALDIARPPAAVPFLVEVLQEGDSRFAPYAENALKGINTPEARTALWKATHPQHGT